MWTYNSTTGEVTDPDGNACATVCYSGHEDGLNNPAMEQIHDVGPIPRGEYLIGEFFNDTDGKGPIVAHLYPMTETDVFGRSGFMIHGDNILGDKSASHGCIIAARQLRTAIQESGDKVLKVI